MNEIDICLILFNHKNLYRFKTFISNIKKYTKTIQNIYIYIPDSSPLTELEVFLHITKLNIKTKKITKYKDIYFDYSGYLLFCNEEKTTSNDIIFLNDTLLSKHYSMRLIKEFSQKIACCNNKFHESDILIGPYCLSEFTFSNPDTDSFVPTYLFFINKNSIHSLKNILQTMPSLNRDLIKKSTETLLSKCMLSFAIAHSNQISKRYSSNSRLLQKLTTSCVERLISIHYKNNGVIWFCDYGLINQTIVKIEKIISRKIHLK